MKEISGERLYKNIQYYWIYRKGRPIEDLKAHLGSRYAEYQLLPKMNAVPNRIVTEYAKILRTSVGKLRLKDKKRDGVVEGINKKRADKYNLSEAENYNEQATTFIGAIPDSRKSATPKPDTSSKKWNDNDAKKLRKFLEERKRGDIDDSEFDRWATK